MTLEDRLRRTLAHRAAATRVSNDGWARIDARLRPAGARPRRAFAVAASVPLAVVAIVVAVSLVGNDPGSRVVTGPAADGPAAERPTMPDGTPSDTGGGAGAQCTALPSDGPAADQALEHFFAARIMRDWEAAQPFITSRFAAGVGGRDGFIGASSPRVDRFTVFGDLERTADRARICARTYESTSADRSYSDDSFLVVRGEDGQWRVDEWHRGPMVTYSESTDYTIWFVAPDAPNCGIDEAERTPAVVSIPESPDSSRRVIEELLSGPLGRTPQNSAATTSLPLDARIRSFTIDDGEAHLDLTDPADAGGGACLQTSRLVQLRRTLLSVPGVTDATITAGGRPSGESFQP